MPSSNLTTAFAGRLAGVISYQRSGEPGEDNASFFIRGITTFGAGKKDPLILIDGVELTTNDLAHLNTDDIESFSILKDAKVLPRYMVLEGRMVSSWSIQKRGGKGKQNWLFDLKTHFPPRQVISSCLKTPYSI